MSAFIAWMVETSLVLTWAFLFLLLGVAGEVGYRIGQMFERRDHPSDGERGSAGAVVAAMVTLLAFGMGLTISFAQTRYEIRRDLVGREANAIGTVWLRAGLFAEPHGPNIQRLTAEYARTRLGFLAASNKDTAAPVARQVVAMQTDIWAEVKKITDARTDPVAASLVAAVNDMFDLSLSQHYAYLSRVPAYLLWAILIGSLLSVGAMQYQFGLSGRRQPLLIVLLLLMWTGAFVLIIDLNQPRVGEFRIDATPLEWTLAGFGPPTGR